MDKEKLLELALKIGIKKENFDFGMEKNAEGLTKTILDAAKFMGLLKEEEVVEEKKEEPVKEEVKEEEKKEEESE